jgi:hypothetical protein
MAAARGSPSLRLMKRTFPVIWAIHDRTRTGKLEAFKDRLELTSRDHTLSFSRDAVTHYAVERRADARIRGLPAVTVQLAGGEIVRIASLGGPGSLHEIAATVAAPGDNEGGLPQELAGAGT